MIDILLSLLIFISVLIIADIISFLIDEFKFRVNSHNARSLYKQIHENGFEINLISSLTSDGRIILKNDQSDILHIKKRHSARSQIIEIVVGKTILFTDYFNQTYAGLFIGGAKLKRYKINDTYAAIYHKFEDKLQNKIDSHDLSKSSYKQLDKYETILYIILFDKTKEYDVQVESVVGPTSIDIIDCVKKIEIASTDLVWSIAIDHHNKTCTIQEPVLKIGI